MKKHADLLDGVPTRSQRRTEASIVQGADQASKQPHSNVILGTPQQMLETLEITIAGAQKDEQAAQQAHEELKASAKTATAVLLKHVA